MTGEATEPDHPTHALIVERYATQRQIVKDAIEELQAEGRIPAEVDPEAVATLIFASWDCDGMAWSASDKVALVAEPGLFSVAGTERTMRAIQLFKQEFAPNLSAAGIVANRVRTGSSEHTYRLAEMESMFGDLLLSPRIPEQANWQQIQGAAHPVHHWPGESAKSSAALFDALLVNLLAAGSGLRNRTQR